MEYNRKGRSNIEKYMVRFYISSLIVLCHYLLAQGQEIRGFVYDGYSGESLPNAWITTGNLATSTNAEGYFSMKFSNYRDSLIHIGCFGYADTILAWGMTHQSTLSIRLRPAHLLQAVEITANKRPEYYRDGEYLKNLTGNLPVIAGEKDLGRILQILPGVSPAEEGESRLNVRGSDDYQNAYFLDGIRIFNPNHVGGYLSSFNVDVLKDFKLQSGAFLPEWSGFTSSMIDANTLDGDTARLQSRLHFGLVSSSVGLNGPLVKGKAGFSFAARISPWGELLRLLSAGYNSGKKDSKYFYGMNDMNLKLHYKFSTNSGLAVSVYRSFDHLSNAERYRKISGSVSEEGESIKWSNFGASVKYYRGYKHFFLRSITSMSYYRYSGETIGRELLPERDTLEGSYYSFSNIMEVRNATSLSKRLAHHDLSAGLEGKFSGYLPTVYDLKPLKRVNLPYKIYQLSFFANDNIHITNRMELSAGVRVNKDLGDLDYFNVEPRARFNYRLRPNINLSASYSRLSQNYHKILSSSLLELKDVWVAADNEFVPGLSDVWDIGFSRSSDYFKNISVAIFYKTMRNQLFYRSYSDYEFFLAEDWRTDIYSGGKGRAYGVEMNAIYQRRPYFLSMNLTVSRSFRRFAGLNDDHWFPFDYDRPVVGNAIFSYDLGPMWKFGAQFVYYSGRRVTLPEAVIFDSPFGIGNVYYVYGEMNNRKLPDYHRLDVSFTKEKKKKKSTRLFSVGCYNVYAMPNYSSYSIDISYEYVENVGAVAIKDVQIKRKTKIPILPYISYSVIF